MSDYKRFVSYLYDYENGIKKSNVGYVRVEVRNNQCKMTVSLKAVGTNSNSLRCYIFKRYGAKIKCLSLGDGLVKNGVYELKLLTDSNNLSGSSYSLDEMGGIIIYSSIGKFFATEWDDKPIVLSEIENLDSKSSENTKEQDSYANSQPIDKLDKINDLTEDKENQEYNLEEYDNADNIEIKKKEENQTTYIEKEYETTEDNNSTSEELEVRNNEDQENENQENEYREKNYEQRRAYLQYNEEIPQPQLNTNNYSSSNINNNINSNHVNSLEEVYHQIERNKIKQKKYPNYTPTLSNELREELQTGSNHYRYNNQNYNNEKVDYEKYNSEQNLTDCEYDFSSSIKNLKEIIKERLDEEARRNENLDNKQEIASLNNNQLESTLYSTNQNDADFFNYEQRNQNYEVSYENDLYYSNNSMVYDEKKLISSNNRSVKVKPVEYQYYDYYNRPIIKWVDPNTIKKIKVSEFQQKDKSNQKKIISNLKDDSQLVYNTNKNADEGNNLKSLITEKEEVTENQEVEKENLEQVNNIMNEKEEEKELHRIEEVNTSITKNDEYNKDYDTSTFNVNSLKLSADKSAAINNNMERLQIEELRRKEQIAKNYMKSKYQTNIKGEDSRRETREKRAINESLIANRIFDSYPKLNAFSDKEFNECVRIEPQDLGLFPVDHWILGNNSFLLHGYYSYRHLLFAMKKTNNVCQYFLGVPGVFQNRERFVANMFGFHYFKPSKGKDLKEGEFGYWYMEIGL